MVGATPDPRFHKAAQLTAATVALVALAVPAVANAKPISGYKAPIQPAPISGYKAAV